MKDVSKQVKLTVWKNRMKYEFLLPVGKNLRKVLIEKGVSPYSAFNNKINCRGNGLCATCGVFVIGIMGFLIWEIPQIDLVVQEMRK